MVNDGLACGVDVLRLTCRHEAATELSCMHDAAAEEGCVRARLVCRSFELALGVVLGLVAASPVGWMLRRQHDAAAAAAGATTTSCGLGLFILTFLQS